MRPHAFPSTKEAKKRFLFLCLAGGDLSFHLNELNNRRFSEERARFYAAEMVLGLGTSCGSGTGNVFLSCLSFMQRILAKIYGLWLWERAGKNGSPSVL